MKTIFLRVIESEDKALALRMLIRDPQLALGKHRFEVDVASFASVPRSPCAYWVSDRLRRLFQELDPFEAEGRTAQRALSTNSDFRYLRLAWERLADRAITRPASGWFPFAKGGAFSPYYADIHLVVKWIDEGREIEAEAIQKFPYLKGNAEWVLHRECNYLRPGLTWPIKNRFSLKPRFLPAGCIFAHVGPSAFIEGDDAEELAALLAVMSSSIFTALLRIMAGWNFEVGIIQRTPVPQLGQQDQTALATLARRAWSLKRGLDTSAEVSHAFTLPGLLQVTDATLAARASSLAERIRMIEAEVAAIQMEIDEHCFDLYDISTAERLAITDGFGDHGGLPESAAADEEASEDHNDDEAELGASLSSLAAELASWAVGVAVGRFDLRLATGERHLPTEPGPFDVMLPSSPGMLTDDKGCPLMDLPIPYPMGVSSVLVSDPGHPLDITQRVRLVFDAVFREDADEWWADVGMALGVKGGETGDWLRSDFFGYHLKTYSKSRRKAPILWPIGTKSGSYIIWFYAHCVSADSLFQAINDLVVPKVLMEERELSRLRQNAGVAATALQRKVIDAKERLVGELREFREQLDVVAPLWAPDLNDGIAVVLAPMWRLFAHHRAWSNELKRHWVKLARGDYDWARLAMHLWPERVVPKCAEDRSLAIAHGLEDVFWMHDPDNEGKWLLRQVPATPVEELITQRHNPATSAALQRVDT